MKCILSIDGGGIRGIIPALVLAEIEKRLQVKLCNLFDLMAGTSTGGILALGLSKPNDKGQPQYSAGKLAELYEKRGKDIFSRSLWKRTTSAGGILDELYNEDGLETVLKEYFGDTPVGAALTNVLVTSYDIQARTPFFFKSWRDESKTVPMRHAGRATSAAPTYFEPKQLSVNGVVRTLVDGGVFINNPAVSAFVEGTTIFEEEDDFYVLSLGTGELVRPISYEDAKDWGVLGWARPAVNCMFDGVSDAVNYQMKKLLKDAYARLQITLDFASDDMDDASNGNIRNLQQEAELLLKTHGKELDVICARLEKCKAQA